MRLRSAGVAMAALVAWFCSSLRAGVRVTDQTITIPTYA